MPPAFTPEDSFTNPAVQRCPFPLIARLHAEAPVYKDPVTGFYIVTRYDDIAHISANPGLFSNQTSLIMSKAHSPVAAEVAKRFAERGFKRVHTLVTNDPPDHGKYRGLVDKVFSPAFVKSLEPGITDLAEGLIDAFIDDGEVDLLREYCVKIPIFVIADQLGVPRSEWKRFKAWSDAAIEAINPAIDPDRELALTDIIIDAQNYLFDRAMAYRDAPQDKLLSLIANAKIDGRLLEPAELVGVAEQLLVAGNETTTSAMAIAVWMLAENTSLQSSLTGAPEKIPAFVEEVLRLHAPSPHLYREARADTRLGDVNIPKGSIVQLSYLAGNRDPARYENPETLDLTRQNIRNHLAFGRGIHFCLGNKLARTELRIAIARLLARLGGFRLSPNHPPPAFAASYHVHTLESLHIAF